MTRIYFTLIISSISLIAHGQEKTDCENVNNRTPYFLQFEADKIDSLIQLDLQVIEKCIDLDEIDKMFLSPPALGTLLLQLTKENSDLKYAQVIEYISDLKSTEEYKKGKEGLVFSLKYGDKIVNKVDSVQIRKNYRNMGLTDSDLNELMEIIYSDQNSNLTYKEAFATFIQSKEPKQKTKTTPKTDLMFGHFKEIESLSQLKEVEQAKHTLLYFTGWADINGRKLESAFFNEIEIQTLFGEYNCFLGYADDKTAIEPEQQKQFPNVPMKTKGQFINEIEKSLFPKAYQPVILVVDSEFELIDSYSYNKDRTDFLEFLKRNKNVR